MDNQHNQPEDKIEAGDINIAEKSKFFKWLDNFWYHYKWTLLIAVFFIVVLVVGLVQLFSKTESVATVMYAGPYQLSNDEINAIRNDLTSLLPYDFNGDEKKYITFIEYAVFSEDEIESSNEIYTDENGEYVDMVSPMYNSSKYREYLSYTSTGECSIYFVSEYLYENLKNEERLVPISEVLGDTGEYTVADGGYGIRLGDTDLYKYFTSLQILPADTVVCLMRPYVWGESSNEEKYEFASSFFKELAEFKINE